MNIKLIAVTAACFIGGTAAGTFLTMRGSAEAHAEGAAADSTHVEESDETSGDDGHAVEPPSIVEDTADATVDSHAPAAAPSAGASDTVHADSTAAPADSSHAAPPPPAADSVPADPAASLDGDEATARLARIFGAMRPEEAARLLEPIPDSDVRAVLFALSDRKAALILANFKGERAAALARALIARGGAS